MVSRLSDEDEELAMIAKAEERESQKLEIDNARLEMEKGQAEIQREEILLRREVQKQTAKESEARLKLEHERLEEEKMQRAADRSERKALCDRQDKMLEAMLNMISKRKT